MKHGCAELERRLEALLGGELSAAAARACEAHLAACPRCRELVTLASLEPPAEGAAGVAAGVLTRTTGSTCRRAEALLCDLVDGELDAGDRALLTVHLEHCDGCAELVGALARLERDLPTLAELETDRAFVSGVLAATLPLPVRVRRWWRAVWPALLRRPRFAAELAYVATVLLVVVITLPGSPLQAMPRQALALARKPPVTLVEEPLREGLAVLGTSDSARALGQLRERMPELLAATKQKARTFLADLASLLENGSEDSASPPGDTTEDKP